MIPLGIEAFYNSDAVVRTRPLPASTRVDILRAAMLFANSKLQMMQDLAQEANPE